MRATWQKRCGQATTAWSIIFAAAHFYWGFGGDIGLAVSAGPQLAAERPAWFVAGGLFGVGTLCLAGAVIGRTLTQGRVRGLPRLLVRLTGGVIGIVLLARAITVETLLLAGSALNDTVGPAHRFWTLALWNPWFAVGGIAFLGAALSAGGDFTKLDETAADQSGRTQR